MTQKNLEALRDHWKQHNYPAVKLADFVLQHANNHEYLEYVFEAMLDAVREDKKASIPPMPIEIWSGMKCIEWIRKNTSLEQWEYMKDPSETHDQYIERLRKIVKDHP